MAKREKNMSNAHLNGRDGDAAAALGDIGYYGKDTAECKKRNFFKKRPPF